MKAAQTLQLEYMDSRSFMEVNLDHKVKTKTMEGIESGTQDCFESAKGAIFKLLDSNYRRFVMSPLFETMKQDLCK